MGGGAIIRTLARRTIFRAKREGARTYSRFARKQAQQFHVAHAYDWGRHLCRANRFDVCDFLSAQPNVRASETFLRVISKTDDATTAFRLKRDRSSSAETRAAASPVENEVIKRRLRVHTRCGEAVSGGRADS